MVTSERLIKIIRPLAAETLGFDAAAVKHVKDRSGGYAGLDPQPAAAAMAMERRAYVVTELRKFIAGRLGWSVNEKKLPCGGYEWFPEDGLAVRLAKSTPESRQEAAMQLLGIQGEFALQLPPPKVADDEREVILIRLMGNPLNSPSVDVVPLKENGKHGPAIPLLAIAQASTERLPSTGTPPAKTTVTLPGDRRIAESG
jgi:hypothetical protein